VNLLASNEPCGDQGSNKYFEPACAHCGDATTQQQARRKVRETAKYCVVQRFDPYIAEAQVHQGLFIDLLRQQVFERYTTNLCQSRVLS
jgi:hypothetical protein